MFVFRFYCSVLLTLAFCANSAAQTELKPTVKSVEAAARVYFIGNSFSYYNNGIATHYANLIRTSDFWRKGGFTTRQKTISGGRLAEHVAGFNELLALPPTQSWDVVVLQEYSNGPIKNENTVAEFQQASSELAKIVREHNARPVFFMTWAYKRDLPMVQQLRDAYVTQGNKLDMLVAPVGLAFAASQEKFPAIELYTQDVQGLDDQAQVVYQAIEKQPSLAGSYLAACVFYATLQGKSPVGIRYTAGLPLEQAKQLQDIAWQTTEQFFKE